MKSAYLSLVSSLLLLLSVHALWGQQSIAIPVSQKVEVTESLNLNWASTSIDVGRVQLGEKVEFTYNFVNEGKEPIAIKRVKPGCGCTTVGYSKESIPAGGEGYVQASYHAKHKGYFNKTVSVFVDDQAKPIVLQLKGFAEEQTENPR